MNDVDGLLVAVVPPVITVTLNRPAKRNAINEDMWNGLRDAAERLATDPDLRVLVLEAAGEFFTAGADISGGMDPGSRAPGPTSGAPATPDGGRMRWGYRTLHDIFDLFEAVEKPVVAVVDGPCLGAGVECIVSFDFRIASTRATFGLPELKLGVVPGSGGISRLTRLVGPAAAKAMVMRAAPIDADHALRIGLVSEVVAPESLAAARDRLIADLVALPAGALGLAKRAIDLVTDLDAARGRDVERLVNSLLIGSPENQERLAAFAARRDDGRAR